MQLIRKQRDFLQSEKKELLASIPTERDYYKNPITKDKKIPLQMRHGSELSETCSLTFYPNTRRFPGAFRKALSTVAPYELDDNIKAKFSPRISCNVWQTSVKRHN